MASRQTHAPGLCHHMMERQQHQPRTLHEQMMVIAEPIIQHNWTDVAIHDKATLRSLPVGYTAYWVVTQMGSYLTPAYCRLSDRSRWTSGNHASVAPIQFLVIRWHAEAGRFEGSTPWRRIHDPFRDKHCFLVTKTSSSEGVITPIRYQDLAEMALPRSYPVVKRVAY